MECSASEVVDRKVVAVQWVGVLQWTWSSQNGSIPHSSIASPLDLARSGGQRSNRRRPESRLEAGTSSSTQA